jgi:hypothetical protein
MNSKLPRVKSAPLIKLMNLFSSTDSIDKDRLAMAMTYGNYSGVSNHVNTGIIMDMLELKGDSILVTSRGKEFTKGLEYQIKIVSNFLTDNNDGLGIITDCLRSEGVQFDISDLQKCVQLHVDTPAQAKKYTDILVDWYEFASMLSRNDDIISSALSLKDFQLGQSLLYSNVAIDFKLFLDLTSVEFSNPSSLHQLSHQNIEKKYQEFVGSNPQDSEIFMLEFVSRVFRILGFSAIFRNGPRTYGNLRFGSEGDDLLIVLPNTGRTIDSTISGISLACELKRRIGSKTAVGQAVTFMNQVKSEFPNLQVFPIVITNSDCYHDRIAKSYAHSSQVMHIPLDFIYELLNLQLDLYNKAKPLITALDFLNVFLQFRSAQEIEPRTPDLLGVFK